MPLSRSLSLLSSSSGISHGRHTKLRRVPHPRYHRARLDCGFHLKGRDRAGVLVDWDFVWANFGSDLVVLPVLPIVLFCRRARAYGSTRARARFNPCWAELEQPTQARLKLKPSPIINEPSLDSLGSPKLGSFTPLPKMMSKFYNLFHTYSP